MNENLSQEEVDALLNGVDSGAVKTDVDKQAFDGEVIPYDLGQELSIRGCMTTLNMVNERFTRHFKNSLLSMLRRVTEVTVKEITTIKFSEYISGIPSPSNINMITIKPLNGTALFVIDPKLIFTTVDIFFGGEGRFSSNDEERDFTPAENRIVQLMLNLSFTDLKKAWETVVDLDYKYVRSETNPQYINVISPTEVVVLSTFEITIEGCEAGEFQMVIPYNMLEPLEDLFDNGRQSSQTKVDQNWLRSLKDEIKQAVVEIDCSIAHTKLTLGEVLKLSPGDVIPIKFSDVVTVRAAKTPIFKATLGASNGKNAVRFIEAIKRPNYTRN